MQTLKIITNATFAIIALYVFVFGAVLFGVMSGGIDSNDNSILSDHVRTVLTFLLK